MYDLKYYEGFSDALASVTQILQIMVDETEKAIKNKDYSFTAPIVARGIFSIAEIWEEANEKNREFAKKVAKRQGIEYTGKSKLFVDPETKRIERRDV